MEASESKSAEDSTSEPAVLPYFGLSVWALLALFVRWAFFSEARGGMKKVDHRLAPQQLLQVLFDIMCEGGQEWSIPLDMAPGIWQNDWPRPLVNKCPVVVKVRPDGALDLIAWTTYAGADAFSPKHPLRSWLSQIVGGLQRMTLVDFFKFAAMRDSMRQLYRQVLWFCGKRLQVSLTTALRKETTFSSSVFNLAEYGCDELISAAHTLHRMLVRYTIACRGACLGQTCIAVSTDKATVCGMSLQQCLVALPNNAGIVCPPQASFGNWGRHPAYQSPRSLGYRRLQPRWPDARCMGGSPIGSWSRTAQRHPLGAATRILVSGTPLFLGCPAASSEKSHLPHCLVRIFGLGGGRSWA